MPGICGIVESAPHASSQHLLDRMLQRMSHSPSYRVERTAGRDASVSGPVAAFGQVDLDRSDYQRPSTGLQRGSHQVVLAGEIYNVDDLAAYLRNLSCEDVDTTSPRSLMMAGVLRKGTEFLRRVRGKYTVAIWDAARSRLTLANDAFGMKPLYYARQNGRLVFASEIKAVLADSAVSRRQNMRGLGQFFSFGHLWGEETFFEAVKALPPAACLVFHAEADCLEIQQYWRPQPLSLAAGARENEWIDHVDSAFQRSLAEQTENAAGLTLSLSGGMDSRTLLGAIDTSRTRPLCVSLGMRGSQDHLRAAEMARLAGCRHEQYTLDDRFLARFEQHLDRMVQLTDGHYLSQCIVMPTLPFYEKLGARILLRGHAGELMHLQKAYNFSHDADALSLADNASLERWLFQRLRSYMLEGLDAPLFEAASSKQMEQIARETITSALRDSTDWSPPAQRISHVFLTQRLRRETALSLVKFDSIAETRVPYLDPQLIEAVLGAPLSLKLHDQIQTELLRRHRPEFLGVRNVNTGARVDAGAVGRTLGTFRQRVMAKLGVPGYQPYERLGLWLRRDLQPVVRSILLNERCLDRGIYRADTVRTVVEQHMQQERNHTFLLLALMIFEHGQRRLDYDWDPWAVDGEAVPSFAYAANGT